MADVPPPPGAVSKDMAERVLRRAAELTPDLALHGVWADSSLPEHVLVAAAAEVGIEPAAVQQALALERLGPTPPARLGDRVVGPRVVVAEATTAWSPEDTLRLIDDWLCQAHHLRRERTRADGGEWRRRRDPLARAQRALRGLNGEGRLGDSERIAVTALPIGSTHTVARLQVDRDSARTTSATVGTVVGATGVAGAAVLAVVTSPVLLVAAPFAAFGGVLVARSGLRSAQRAEREALRLLDAVERGERPRRLTDDVRRALRGKTTR